MEVRGGKGSVEMHRYGDGMYGVTLYAYGVENGSLRKKYFSIE